MKVASNQGVLRYFVSNQGVLYNFTLLRFTKENIPYLGLASEISLAFSLESENFCQQNDCIFLFKKVPLSVRTNAFWLMEAGLSIGVAERIQIYADAQWRILKWHACRRSSGQSVDRIFTANPPWDKCVDLIENHKNVFKQHLRLFS